MTQFIAEVSSNHHRDLARCFEFIDTAARIGCSAVKFQLFKIEELFAPEILVASETIRKRKEWELPHEFLPELSQRSREQGIQFACTPFYLNAVAVLEPYVDFYKIASYELLWDDLIRACASTGKPLILSTGMACVSEIQHAVNAAREAGCMDLTLLHCVSSYPAPPSECNLSAIEMLRKLCGCLVGWSDHSVNPAVLYRAIHGWGASTVEFHLDLEGEGEEFVSGHCWLPAQMGEVIANINVGRSADGNGDKQAAPSEISERDWRADPSDGFRPLKSIRVDWKP